MLLDLGVFVRNESSQSLSLKELTKFDVSSNFIYSSEKKGDYMKNTKSTSVKISTKAAPPRRPGPRLVSNKKTIIFE